MEENHVLEVSISEPENGLTVLEEMSVCHPWCFRDSHHCRHQTCHGQFCWTVLGKPRDLSLWELMLAYASVSYCFCMTMICSSYQSGDQKMKPAFLAGYDCSLATQLRCFPRAGEDHPSRCCKGKGQSLPRDGFLVKYGTSATRNRSKWWQHMATCPEIRWIL